MQDAKTFRAMVLEYLRRHPEGATVREVAIATESSSDRVFGLLKRLSLNGLVYRLPGARPQVWKQVPKG